MLSTTLEKVHVLELTLSELEDLAPGFSVDMLTQKTDEFYSEVRRLYLRGDVEPLKKLLDAFSYEQSLLHTACWNLGKLRLGIRTSSSEEKALGQLLDSSALPEIWQGEVHLVIAMYYETLGDDRKAETSYLAAFSAFAASSSPRKAATAYLNATAAMSRVDPKRRLIHEYRKAMQLALDAGDYGTAGTAMFNLSREYQLMGASLVSYELANRAVEAILKTHFGTYQYYLAIAHRSHVSAVLGYTTQALKDFEEVRCSTIAEIASVASDLEKVLIGAGVELRNRVLPSPPNVIHSSHPSWAERVSGALEVEPLTELEDKFLKVLIDGPVDRWVMMRELYGEDSNHRPFVYENRLKQLTHRLRKKRADLFTYRESRFVLIDDARA